MTDRPITRRSWLASASAAGVGIAAGISGLGNAPALARSTSKSPVEGPFRYGMNTATISGQKLPIVAIVDLLTKAGYGAIEPWLREIEAYRDAGGSLPDLKKRLADGGIAVDSAIGFAEWAVDDEAKRRKGLEQLRRDMDLVQAIGGTRIAAPPSGLTDRPFGDVRVLGERYRAACEVGAAIGVVPQAEVWGFSATMSRLGEVVAVLIESGRPEACVLPDIYHLYKGGSAIESLGLLAPRAIHVLHMNDYPANPPRESIKDEHRVYPGDGVAPVTAILRSLRDGGFKVTLSLELFNRALWNRDPAEVAATGLAKMKAAVAAIG